MPDPGRYKDKQKFISDCIRTNINEGLDEEHAKGKCYGVWRGRKKKKKSAAEILREAAYIMVGNK